jgi:deoxyribodipyrimidine photo-lyase
LGINDISKYYTHNPNVPVEGGRQHALAILEGIINGGATSYNKYRDFPAKDCTTKLGAYLKFGCLSPREVYKVIKKTCGVGSVLLSQLFWREFYYNVAYFFPEVLKGQVGGKSTYIRGKYEKTNANWNDNQEQFDAWKEGRTGFPIVDAAMRCMNQTGWMHNRLRMIVAMFLVRDLNVDWRKGERYFATQLVDYDVVNNNQGWLWSVVYRRKLNPFKQTGKFDDQCEFIKKWIPELKDVPVLDIIVWWDKGEGYPQYPSPMIELPGYRVKYKKYIAGYVRPKDPNAKKTKKKSKYGPNKNKDKYNKNKVA